MFRFQRLFGRCLFVKLIHPPIVYRYPHHRLPLTNSTIVKFKLNSLVSLETITSLVYKIFIFCKLLIRLVSLAVLFGPLIVSFPIYYYQLQYYRSDWWIRYLVWSLNNAGPTWIKLGQWLSTRRDLIPDWTCHYFSRLQSNNYPHSFGHTKRVVEGVLGENIEDVFDEFGVEPIGVGAIAQVHKARLKTDGSYVAVKIIHPNSKLLIELDHSIMLATVQFIEFLMPSLAWISLSEEVEEFHTMMVKQLDLSREAKELVKFRANFLEWDSIDFPKIITEYTNQDVLVESWVDGLSLAKFLRYSSVYDKQLATLGLTSFLKMLVLDNHLHADLHPGNILVTFEDEEGNFISKKDVEKLDSIKDKEEWTTALKELSSNGYIPHLFLIDAGLTSSLSPSHFKNFIDLFKAVTDFNGYQISKLMVERSKTPWSVVDFDQFSEKMDKFMCIIKEKSLSFQTTKVQDILLFVFEAVRRHHVKLDSEFTNIAIALMILEGIGKQLEPKMDLINASVPFLIEAMRRRMSGQVFENEKSFWRFLWRSVQGIWHSISPSNFDTGKF